MTKESEKYEPGLAEAKKLIAFLFENFRITSYDFSDRELNVVKMKWRYGLNDKQIAEKMSLSEHTVQKTYRIILYRLFRRMQSSLSQSQDIKTLKAEIKKLQAENERYKIKFDALSKAEKEEFTKLDVVVQSIHDVGFSLKTRRAFIGTNIKTVSDLLQYRLSSLLMMRGFNLKMIEEIEGFTRRHHLNMRR